MKEKGLAKFEKGLAKFEPAWPEWAKVKIGSGSFRFFFFAGSWMEAHTSRKRAACPGIKPWAPEWETEFLTDILGVLLVLLRLRPTFGNLPEVQLGFKFGTCIILIDLLTWLCFMAYMLHYILYINSFRNFTPLKANQTQNFLVPNSTRQAEMSPKSFWKIL